MALRSFAALLVLVALLALPVTAPGAPAPGTAAASAGGAVQEATATGTPASGTTATPTAVNRSTLPPSEVTWRVRLQPDGDARWTVSMQVPIRDRNDAAAFDELAASFDEAENPLALDFFRTAAARASNATGRDMGIRDVSRSARRTDTNGTLAVSFLWSNFARVEGDRLYVGDGFNTTRGTWLPALTDHQTLVVVPPSGYGVTSAPSVGITGGAARWDGPTDLSGREPWIVYSGDAPTPTPTLTPTNSGPTTSPGTGTPGTDSPDEPLGSLLPVVGLTVLAGVAAAVLVVYMRHDESGVGAIGGTTDDDGGSGPAATDETDGVGTESGTDPVETAPPADASTDAEDAPSGDAGGATAASAGAETDDADDAAASDDIDEALLSDEERVERLLEQNGGRMKQASIVKETGWSNAKVSQLLSSMAEEGRVDKLRIGRENLISFPDEDVTDIDSPE